MKKYAITISAIVCDKTMIIFSQEFAFNMMTHVEQFLEILRIITPTVDWKFDDGDIKPYTEYLQYSTSSDDDGNYLLATWCKTSDYKEVELFNK